MKREKWMVVLTSRPFDSNDASLNLYFDYLSFSQLVVAAFSLDIDSYHPQGSLAPLGCVCTSS